MSRRLWGVIASQTGMLHSALSADRLSLDLASGAQQPVGWGIGFYQDGEPLVRKCPLEDPPRTSLLDVVSEITSDVLVGHVREPTVGSLSSENTHPFRFRHWLFAHGGTIACFSDIKEQMGEAMPDFLKRSLGGETDSECFFHLVLAFLHDAGQLAHPRPEAMADALGKALIMVDELERAAGCERPSPLNVVMTNGYSMLALHRSPVGLSYLTYEAPGRAEVRPRAVIVACEHARVGWSWIDLPPSSILLVRRDLAVEVISA